MKILFTIIITFTLFVSCKKDDATNSADPSNLVVEVSIFEDPAGYVEVEATANNAVEYEFDFGESGSELVKNSTGIITYTYTSSGNYELIVKAYGTSGRFLKKSKTITVDLGDSTIIDDTGYSTPLSYNGMTLVWNDEFEGDELNETFWNYEIGTGSSGWGNNELQYYRRENTSVTQGFLVIEAKNESFGGNSYTSSRLTTQDKFDFQYGRVDIRAKLPKGQGIWPALWMLGANFKTVGWPFCGEIDIMEMIGGGEGRDDVVHGTVHWDDGGTKADFGGNTQLSQGIFNDEFHVFTIVWNSSQIVWYLDDSQYHVIDITPEDLSEFQNRFFFIFNVAVGGNWPGSPDSSTVFPQQMLVDYVRVFQNE